MLAKRFAISAITLSLSAALVAGYALADQVTNGLDNTVDTALENLTLPVAGQSTVTFVTKPKGNDGDPGCNLDTASDSVTFNVLTSNANVTVAPSTITFQGTGCNITQSVVVTGVSSGSTLVSLTTGANVTGGTYDTAPASFTVNVNGGVTPPPAVNGNLTVIKHVVNAYGGTNVAGDFTMLVDGHDPSSTSFPGNEAGTVITLKPGQYDISETGPFGYAATYSADCTGHITTTAIQPQLQVVKHVINDNGGSLAAAAFTMNLTGTNLTSSTFPGNEAGTTVGLDVGAYGVTESGSVDYAGTLSADCSGTIGLGETKTCTVTNDDIVPHIRVIKHVINDNTGTKTASGFTMQVSAVNPDQTSFPGADGSGVLVRVDAGSYTVSEILDPGYDVTYSADCTGSIQINQIKTCVITNDDKVPTRGQGFWSTHKTYATTIGGNVLTVGSPVTKTLDTTGKLMGAFWSSIPYKSNGKTKRAAVDQTRMQLVQQLVAAKLNCKASVCKASTLTQIANADIAYSTGNVSAMQTLAGQLGTFNGSGEAVAMPLPYGSAEQNASKMSALLTYWDVLP
jgi:hypothetical protein